MFKRLPREIKDDVLTDAVREGGKVMHSAIKAKVPVSANGKGRSKASQAYGHLKENVRLFKLKLDIPKNKVIFRVSTTDAFWGNFLEYGTKMIQAMPWFRPAADAAADRAAATIVTRITDGINEIIQKYAR